MNSPRPNRLQRNESMAPDLWQHRGQKDLDFRSLLELVQVGILVQGPKAEILLSNQVALDLLGLTEDQLLGKTSFDPTWNVMREDGSVFAGIDHPVPQAILTRKPVLNVVMGVYRPSQKDRVWLLVNANPQLTATGKVQQVICSFTDISHYKAAEAKAAKRAEAEHFISLMAQHIRQSLDLQQILQTTVAEVRHFLQTDRVVIFRFQPDWSGSVVVESVAEGWRKILGSVFHDPCFNASYAELYRQGRILATSDLAQEESLQPCYVEFLRLLQVQANLVVPILANNQLWGLLIAHECGQPRAWQSLEIDLLRTLSVQVGIAIQQSELYQQVQHLNAELKYQVEIRTAQLQQSLQFEALLKRITDKVRDSLDETQILQAAVQELAQGLAVGCCDIAQYDLDQKRSIIRYEVNSTGLHSFHQEILMSDFPDLYQQLLQGQNFQFCMLHPKLFRDYAAILAMPILDDQGILGDIWLFRQRDAGFIEPEIRLIQQVANQCAIAVRQARLYQLSQQQVQQLEQLHRLKDEFLSTVSHELRTPIANMKLAIHLLQRDIAPERREHYLSMLQLECNREADLINDLLDLQRLEAQAYPVVLESICLTEWLPGVLEPFRDRTQHQQQSLQLMCSPHLPLISTDGSILRRILAELLNNACKYTVAGGQIVLQASYLTSSAKVEVVVGNSAEIPAAELTLIFNKFYRVPQQDPWKLGGTGLGLALVQKLVAQLRGTLQVSSENGWTEFRVLLSIHSPANPLPSGADSPP